MYYLMILIFEYLNINNCMQIFLYAILVSFISFFKNITYMKTIIFYILIITLLNYSPLFSMLLFDY